MSDRGLAAQYSVCYGNRYRHNKYNLHMFCLWYSENLNQCLPLDPRCPLEVGKPGKRPEHHVRILCWCSCDKVNCVCCVCSSVVVFYLLGRTVVCWLALLLHSWKELSWNPLVDFCMLCVFSQGWTHAVVVPLDSELPVDVNAVCLKFVYNYCITRAIFIKSSSSEINPLQWSL